MRNIKHIKRMGKGNSNKIEIKIGDNISLVITDVLRDKIIIYLRSFIYSAEDSIRCANTYTEEKDKRTRESTKFKSRTDSYYKGQPMTAELTMVLTKRTSMEGGTIDIGIYLYALDRGIGYPSIADELNFDIYGAKDFLEQLYI